jgi:hypothetical protein
VQAADVVILVPRDDSAAERQRFVLVVWLARMYAVCEHTCPSAESRPEFGIGADDCVSSEALVISCSGEPHPFMRKQGRPPGLVPRELAGSRDTWPAMSEQNIKLHRWNAARPRRRIRSRVAP